MNTTQHIEFIEWKEIPSPYSPRWWDKPRWWLVRLLGGICPHDTVKVVTVPVNGKDFMARLWKQKRALVESFHREPTTLLIGGEDYAELMQCQMVRQHFYMNASFNYGREVYGLTVKVIPWMRGMVVMP